MTKSESFAATAAAILYIYFFFFYATIAAVKSLVFGSYTSIGQLSTELPV